MFLESKWLTNRNAASRLGTLVHPWHSDIWLLALLPKPPLLPFLSSSLSSLLSLNLSSSFSSSLLWHHTRHIPCSSLQDAHNIKITRKDGRTDGWRIGDGCEKRNFAWDKKIYDLDNSHQQFRLFVQTFYKFAKLSKNHFPHRPQWFLYYPPHKGIPTLTLKRPQVLHLCSGHHWYCQTSKITSTSTASFLWSSLILLNKYKYKYKHKY